jgi:hypothetical protein
LEVLHYQRVQSTGSSIRSTQSSIIIIINIYYGSTGIVTQTKSGSNADTSFCFYWWWYVIVVASNAWRWWQWRRR